MRAQQRQKKPKWSTSTANRATVRWLVFCFPIGLLMMWSDRCRWSRAVKSAVSLTFVALVLALALPQTHAPEHKAGGVQIVSAEGATDQMGPTPRPDGLQYDVYVPKYIPKNSLAVQPTPTPEPYWVYCNDGGEFYHEKKCKYVKEVTPKVSLLQAVDAGFKRCKKCRPPTPEELYGIEYAI